MDGLNALPVLVRRRGVTATVEELADLTSRFAALVLTGLDARCLAIERGLEHAAPDLAVVHERHGLSAVALACLRHALGQRGGFLSGGRVVIRGAGAAAVSVVGLLRRIGVDEVVVLGHGRMLTAGEVDPRMPHHLWLAAHTNPRRLRGGPAEAASDALAILDLEGGAWDITATARRMAPQPVLVLLTHPSPARPLEPTPPGAIVARCIPPNTDAITGLDVVAGLVKGLATTGTSRIDEDVLEAAATGLEFSMTRARTAALTWCPLDVDIADAVAKMVAATVRA